MARFIEKSSKIIDDYFRFSRYAEGAGKNEITILWGSMYGMTAKAIDYVEDILQRKMSNTISFKCRWKVKVKWSQLFLDPQG